MTCLSIRVEGRVQGVGFRYYTKTQADQLGLGGWVKNCPDGSVEIEAHGDDDSLHKFKLALRQGPSLSYVSKLQATRVVHNDPSSDFRIRY